MASNIISGQPIRLRDYRYPGEVLSLVLTFLILLTLYTLAAIFLATNWEQTIKTFIFTVLGLSVYVITVLVQQRAALGTLVRVGPRQFPEVYERAILAAECLSSPPVPVYVKRSPMMIYTLGLWRQPIIVVTSSLVEQMGLDDLQFFIGREIGHIQAGHIWLRTLLRPLGAEVPVIGKLLNSIIFGDWMNRSEFTADRAGFIACRSLTTAVSAMIKFGVGIQLYGKLDIREFLEQIHEVHNVRGRVTEIVAEQPYLTERVRALVRFSLSEQFQQIVPEKRTYTQILSALPQNFLSSTEIKAVIETPPALSQLADQLTTTRSDSKLLTAADPITVLELENSLDFQLQLTATDTKQSHILRHCRTRIGRSRDNDIVINHDRVSRYHAEIIREGSRLLLTDHESRNGVWLNGWKISEPTELKSGDLIRIGGREFTFMVKNVNV